MAPVRRRLPTILPNEIKICEENQHQNVKFCLTEVPERRGRKIRELSCVAARRALQSIVYGAFDLIAEKTEKSPVEIFESAIKNVAPTLK